MKKDKKQNSCGANQKEELLIELFAIEELEERLEFKDWGVEVKVGVSYEPAPGHSVGVSATTTL